ncbi:hypothetical protein JST97_17945 [bacterium]|nr:hypothetical protein [bacterium]
MQNENEKPKTLDDYHGREDSSSAWEAKENVRGHRRDVVTRAADVALSWLGDESAIQRRHADSEFRKGHEVPDQELPAETSPGSNMRSGQPPRT